MLRVVSFFVMFFVMIAGVSALEIARDNFNTTSWSGGTGWSGGWFHQGDSAIVSTDTPHEGGFHLRLRRATGYVDRQLSFAGQNNVSLNFFAKVSSFEGNDFANLIVSSDGVNWNVLKRFNASDSDGQYHAYQFDLSQYGSAGTFWIAIDAQMSGVDDLIYFDEFVFENDFIPVLPLVPSWHIQFNPTPVNPLSNVHYWNLDLFDVTSSDMQNLHNRTFVMCYFSAGSWENWRPDASEFPSSVLGNNLAGWPGEKWLDIRSPIVRDLMKARIDLGISKGCEGFDPDNMDGYSNNNGLGLTEKDSIDYYNFLADYIHSQEKKVGLKNSLNLIDELLPKMDWAINEQCFVFGECGYLNQVLYVGKPVFNLEYASVGQEQEKAEEICPVANALGFSTLIKHQSLDSFEIACPLRGSSLKSSITALD